MRLVEASGSLFSQATLLKASQLLNHWQHRAIPPACGALTPSTANGVSLPGHTGIPGTEAADSKARRATLMFPQELHHSVVSKRPARVSSCLSLPRPILARVLAARSGHGDFTSYHERFGHQSAMLQCCCGARTFFSHLFQWRIGQHREVLCTVAGKPATLADLLDTVATLELKPSAAGYNSQSSTSFPRATRSPTGKSYRLATHRLINAPQVPRALPASAQAQGAHTQVYTTSSPGPSSASTEPLTLSLTRTRPTWSTS